LGRLFFGAALGRFSFSSWHLPWMCRVEWPRMNLPHTLLDEHEEIKVHLSPAPLDIGDEAVILSGEQKAFFTIGTHFISRFLKVFSQSVVRVLALGIDIVSVLVAYWQFPSSHFQTLLSIFYFPEMIVLFITIFVQYSVQIRKIPLQGFFCVLYFLFIT